MMYEIYVPEIVSNYSCYFYDSTGNILYATNEVPTKNNDIQVEKIFTKNHYNIISTTYHVKEDISCLNISKTDNWFYRNDVVDICILVIIFSIFFFGIPVYLFSRLFKRGVR